MFTDIEIVTDQSDCVFYHSFDFPDGSSVDGIWDLRNRFDDYTGGVCFKNKTVLDVGTASGFLAFEAEKRGGIVTGVDMKITDEWDMVPYAKEPIASIELEREMLKRANDTSRNQRISSIDSVRKSFYFSHNKFSSSVKLYQSVIYDLSTDIGLVDVSIMGAILLHLRDPFLALQKVAEVTKERIIVSDLFPSNYLEDSERSPYLLFLPNAKFTNPFAWWGLTPDVVEKMLAVLGFEIETKSYNAYKHRGSENPWRVWTLVGRRVRI